LPGRNAGIPCPEKLKSLTIIEDLKTQALELKSESQALIFHRAILFSVSLLLTKPGLEKI
jgi:hypothetical protein